MLEMLACFEKVDDGDREFCRVFAFRSVFFSVVVFESRIDADRV